MEKYSFEKIIIALICIGIALIIPYESLVPISLYKYAEIKVSPVDNESHSGKGEAWLLKITADGVEIDLNHIETNGKWQKVDTSIVYVPSSKSTENTLLLRLGQYQEIDLEFLRHAWSGQIRIEDSGHFEYIDLYSPTSSSITYTHKGIIGLKGKALCFLAYMITALGIFQMVHISTTGQRCL